MELVYRGPNSILFRVCLFILLHLQADATIVFPGDDMTVPMQQVPVCEGSTYCETVANYPKNVIKRALERHKTLKHRAFVDEVSEVAPRFGSICNDCACASREHDVFFKGAVNKANEWKLIANLKSFKQGLRIETCQDENAPCSTLTGPGVGYITSCRQKYIYRQLVALQFNGTVEVESFKIPTSCCCHVEFIGARGLTTAPTPTTPFNPNFTLPYFWVTNT